MPEPDLIDLFVHPLNQLGARYFVSGSVAAMLYGEPRVTNDIDFVIFLRSEDLTRLNSAYPSPDFCVPPSSVIMTEISREARGHFNIIHVGSGLKADFYNAKRDELHAWAFQNLRKYQVGEVSISLAPPEYVIIRKLEYFREGAAEKHIRDIQTMLRVSGEKLDRTAMADWIKRRGLENEWKKVG